MLQSQSINFSYDGIHQFCFPDIQLSEGEELLILGESGVGKTTFIQILAGLLKPSSGLLEFNGVQFHNLPSKELDLCNFQTYKLDLRYLDLGRVGIMPEITAN